MMRFWLILSFFACLATADPCSDRCNRMKERSLDRVGFDDERLKLLFERQRPLGTMKDVCWRLYDHLDCMKKCPSSPKYSNFAKNVKNKCKFVLRDMETDLHCITRHHSFLKIRCSSFMKEAENIRTASDLQLTPPREACRFLHLNTICLENTVTSYCPTARKLFRRLHFRDYFLSFVLPKDDTLFDDDDLDSCQLFDFVKESRQIDEEKEEEKLEQEKRRKISGDYDDEYEEELTTLANGMDEDGYDYYETAEKTTKSTPEAVNESEKHLNTVLSRLEGDTSTTVLTPTNSSEAVYEDEYGEYEASDLPVNVVPIEGRKNFSSAEESVLIALGSSNSQENDTAPVVTAPSVETTTPKKLFSEDSMESDPPDFMYSSMRGISTTTIKYVADFTQVENTSEEPLEIDTTTLFGIENVDSTTKVPTKTASEDPVLLMPPSDSTKRPLLSGDIVVKPILSYNEAPKDEEDNDEIIHQDELAPTMEDDPEVLTEPKEETDDRTKRLSVWEYARKTPMIMIFAVISLTVTIMFLACSVLCCACRRTASYHVQKCEA